MIQQSVAAGDQECVGAILAFIDCQFTWLDTICANAPGFDHTLIAQASQSAEGSRPRDLELSSPLVAVKITGDVMNPHKIQVIDIKTPEAVFDGSQSTVCRIVVDDAIWPAALKKGALFAELLRLRFDFVQDDAADF